MNKYDIQLQYNLKASASTDWTSEEALAIHRFAKVQQNMLAERATIYLGNIPQELLRIRLEGKRIRRRLTDAIKSYIDRHPQLSENNRKWLYVNASQRVTLVVFGRKAKKLAEDLGVHSDDLRNALTPDELILLQEVEHTAVRLIDIQDMHPDDAIQQTAERLLISVQNRALKLK